MNKVLEALKHIKSIAKKDIVHGDWSEDVSIKIIEQVLTPPTTDEVCEALSEFYGKKVIYVADVKKFAYEGVDGWQEICYFGKNFKGDVIRFSFSLPPRLITLIGRFYEGLEEMK